MDSLDPLGNIAIPIRGHSQRMSEPRGRGGGGSEKQDKLGHRGGRGVFSNPDVRNLKKFKNKFLFPLF
jgi:hypothetical protein